VALVGLDLRARAATLLGDADGAAIAYARLRPRARYFVVGGTGVVAIDGSAGQNTGLPCAWASPAPRSGISGLPSPPTRTPGCRRPSSSLPELA
jgi:hypothetical protein